MRSDAYAVTVNRKLSLIVKFSIYQSIYFRTLTCGHVMTERTCKLKWPK